MFSPTSKQCIAFVEACYGEARDDHEVLPSAERGLLEGVVTGRDADLVGLVGEPRPGLYFTFVTLVDGVVAVQGRKADTLHRLRLHLESGLRIRHGHGKIVAWLTPDGRLAHAEDEAKEKELRAALSDEVAAIERSRSPSAQAREAVRALSLWRALCAGRFSLVQRVDTDGKRHYAVIENAPAAREFRALVGSILRKTGAPSRRALMTL